MNEMQVWSTALAWVAVVVLVASLAAEEAARAARWEARARLFEEELRELRRQIHWGQPTARFRAARQDASTPVATGAPNAAPLGNGAASDGVTAVSPQAVRSGRRPASAGTR